MSCFSPVSVPSRAKDARPGQTQLVRCGKCLGCLIDRQNAWIYRLEAEIRTRKHSYFVTLTYEDEYLPLLVGADKYDDTKVVTYRQYIANKEFKPFVTTLYPKDLQNYFKRVRKNLPKDCKVRYFACGEYGDGGRPHYHFCLWHDGDPVLVESAINNAWNRGFVQIEPLIPNRVRYCTKYILKDHPENKLYTAQHDCFQRCSNGLGIDGFLKDEKQLAFNGNDTFVGWPLFNGVRISLPRYFRKTFYASDPYTTDVIQQQDENRFKNEKKKFKDFAISYRIEHSCCTDEEIHRAYFRYNDQYESERVHRLMQRKKKDF